MIKFLAEHQLNIMLGLGSICGMTAVLTLMTKGIGRKRKVAMLMMEIGAMILLFADRLAYIYRGDVSDLGFAMTKISNFLVYAMTIITISSTNLYQEDLSVGEAGLDSVPLILRVNELYAIVGLGMVVLSQFTGFYYTFDENNHYVRSPGFFICYLIPVAMALNQLYVCFRYYRSLRKKIFLPLVAFYVLPLVAGTLQIFAYGLSLTNITLAMTAFIIYTFLIVDMNEMMEVSRATALEGLEIEKKNKKRLLDQTATALVKAAEKKDELSRGRAARVADTAVRLAKMEGKTKEECEEIYYAALLHDVGSIGIPDVVLSHKTDLTEKERKILRDKPQIGSEILSSLREYPYLSTGALCSHERYDGSGYPAGLKGKEIPEIARIIAVADAYEPVSLHKDYREALPEQVIREELIKGAGTRFDPVIANNMIRIMDENFRKMTEKSAANEISVKEMVCEKYKDNVSRGVEITDNVMEIKFSCEPLGEVGAGFSAPSIILFDSFDGRVHEVEMTISAYHYLEYAEAWFDGNVVVTGVRDAETYSQDVESDEIGGIMPESGEEGERKAYKIRAARFEDHVKIRMLGPEKIVDITLALPDSSRTAYVSLTGENCRISDIRAEATGEKVNGDDIARIVSKVSYIERLESDVPNVQVDGERTAATQGILLKDDLRLDFHARSLPSANLVWHCPYIVIFHSADGRVGGDGYEEYALLKLNGECEGGSNNIRNKFRMKRTEAFPGWEKWKTAAKKGMECSAEFTRRGNRVTIVTENGGVRIENTTQFAEKPKDLYVALTGDKVALTDIRVL